jgi:hypothetical protein
MLGLEIHPYSGKKESLQLLHKTGHNKALHLTAFHVAPSSLCAKRQVSVVVIERKN